jgi:transposase
LLLPRKHCIHAKKKLQHNLAILYGGLRPVYDERVKREGERRRRHLVELPSAKKPQGAMGDCAVLDVPTTRPCLKMNSVAGQRHLERRGEARVAAIRGLILRVCQRGAEYRRG